MACKSSRHVGKLPESAKRNLKGFQSDWNNGIERTIKVYDVNGKLIQQYDGKFDIDYDDSRILFDDENGKRHQSFFIVKNN